MSSQCNDVSHWLGAYLDGSLINSSRPGRVHPWRESSWHFQDGWMDGYIFRWIFVNENFYILIQISLKFVTDSPIDNNPVFVYMAWRRIGDKPLSEPMLTRLTDAYMRHSGEMSYWVHCTDPINLVSVYKHIHWNENVIILMKFSSLAAPKVVILTTFGAASDEDFIKMKTFSFQCWWNIYLCCEAALNVSF